MLLVSFLCVSDVSSKYVISGGYLWVGYCLLVDSDRNPIAQIYTAAESLKLIDWMTEAI